MASGQFEVWRGGREFLLGGAGRGPETDWAVDPLYEDMDCPMYVDFTQPETTQEDDLMAWFEVYVDREAGKPRSYPLFRHPAMDIALYELEIERLLKAAHTHSPPHVQPNSSLNATPPRRRYNSSSSFSSSGSSPSVGRCSPNSVLGPCSPQASKPKLAPRKGFGVSRSLELSKSSGPRGAAEGMEVIGRVALSGMEDLSEPKAAFKQVPVSGCKRMSETRFPSGTSTGSGSIGLPETKLQSGLRLESGLSRTAVPVNKTFEAGELREQRKASDCGTSFDSARGLKAKRAPESRETAGPSETRRVSASPTNKRYMLPTATSIRKQSPKPARPQQPSADVAEGGPGLRPNWQLPSPTVRRATIRHAPKAEPERVFAPPSSAKRLGDLKNQSVLKKLVKSEVRGSRADLRNSGEERKARFKEMLKSVGATWQQPIGPSSSHKDLGARIDESRRAQWVLAL